MARFRKPEPLFIKIDQFHPGISLSEKTQEVKRSLPERYEEYKKDLSDQVARYTGYQRVENKYIPGTPEDRLRGTTELVGGFVGNTTPRVFRGFKDITTKTLQKLKDRATVSKQFISDLTNSPDLKQAERDTIRRVLEDEKDTISVPAFANKVKSELLPLKATSNEDLKFMPRYESITLPEETRGPVANYKERIYESPIKTSAGSAHFDTSDSDIGKQWQNYFAHTRIEDLPTKESEISRSLVHDTFGKYDGKNVVKEPTRRVIEIQSDLFQKGRLESSVDQAGLGDAQRYFNELEADRLAGDSYSHSDYAKTKAYIEKYKKNPSQNPDLLESYRNTWHERIIREEVKQAAIDGKTKLQFPTGETAMKIERLGQGNIDRWYIPPKGTENLPGGRRAAEQIYNEANKLSETNMKVGTLVREKNDGGQWIITDILGDGKFKAVPKNVTKGKDGWKFDFENQQLVNPKDGETLNLRNIGESFDISGKVDTNHGVYRRYEKLIGPYLKNKYDAKIITDAQGVKWWEVSVPKEAKKMPIEAFAAAPLVLTDTKDKERDRIFKSKNEPLFMKSDGR